MKRTVRMLYASFYSLCVMRVGGRLGRLCGSERAGRGCAVLLAFLCTLAIVSYVVVEAALLALMLFSLFSDSAVNELSHSSIDAWGRDTRSDVHFSTPSLAYADLNASEQEKQRELYAAVEARRAAVVNAGVRRDPSRIVEGARDPNAFRLDTTLSAQLPRPLEAVIDGLTITRQLGTPPLPHLKTLWRTYTATELYERYDDLDFIYSFVNGTEANHYYRKNLRMRCGPRILALEEAFFLTPARPRGAGEAGLDVDGGEADRPAEGAPPTTTPIPNVLDALARDCAYYRTMKNLNNAAFLQRFSGPASAKAVDERDRETDELRHSIRSVEQHVGWHRGRVVIVSPGHHPTWVDGAKNFLAGVCGDATVQALRSRGTHLRLTTVHQDAIMPYGMRFTANSHVIEQHIWRVRNTTAVHVYMNDDYFVNRNVAITDLFNEYGGTIVRTEAAAVKAGKRGGNTVSWAEGVANVELFNIEHLEYTQEDYLPASLMQYWSRVLHLEEKTSAWRRLLASVKAKAERLAGKRRPLLADEAAMEREAQHVLSFRELLLAANTSFYWEAALEPPVATRPLAEGEHTGVLQRYYATHAPFVYCTNMFRHFSVRFREDFAPLQLRHRERMARDYFVPFLYNAFIMARPWEASAQFLPYLLELHRASVMAAADTKERLHTLPAVSAPFFQERLSAEFRRHLEKYVSPASIFLDNEDGCAPATLLRSPASEVVYMRAQDDLDTNRKAMERATSGQALYFNINAGFTSSEAADQLREFLRRQYPTPAYLEANDAADPKGPRNPFTKLFRQLMALPVVGLVSYEEGVCPLVRSLPLAFAGHHRGRVHVAVQRYGDEESDESLRETRARLGHRIISALPATQCSLSPQLSVGDSPRGESISDLAARVIGELSGGVELPATCGMGAEPLRVRGFVVDARTPGAPVASAAALRDALAMPGQTLALEDFRAVRVGPEDGDVVLVLAREDAAAKAVHWIGGASENDLLVTYPLPVEAYEDMRAPVKWVDP